MAALVGERFFHTGQVEVRDIFIQLLVMLVQPV